MPRYLTSSPPQASCPPGGLLAFWDRHSRYNTTNAYAFGVDGWSGHLRGRTHDLRCPGCLYWRGASSAPRGGVGAHCRKRPDVQALLRAEVGALAPQGRPPKGSNTTFVEGDGNDRGSTYALRRLKRVRPDLADVGLSDIGPSGPLWCSWECRSFANLRRCGLLAAQRRPAPASAGVFLFPSHGLPSGHFWEGLGSENCV